MSSGLTWVGLVVRRAQRDLAAEGSDPTPIGEFTIGRTRRGIATQTDAEVTEIAGWVRRTRAGSIEIER